MSGLTPAGFVPKTTQEILDELEASVLATIDPSLDLSPTEPIGQLLGLSARRESLLWELLATLYGALDRNNAEGVLLDNVGIFSGTPRPQATRSTVVCQCVVDGTGPIPAGTVVHVFGHPEYSFSNLAALTAPLPGTYDVTFTALETGPIPANAGTLTVIPVTVPGFLSVSNALDATRGRDVATDAEYRGNQEEDLARGGSSTVPAATSDLRLVKNVLDARVYEDTLAHTMQAVIYDGPAPSAVNLDVATSLYSNKGQGIPFIACPSGNTTVNVTDINGTPQPITFARATQQNVWIEVDVQTVAGYPSNGSDLIKAAILAAAGVRKIGVPVYAFGSLRAAPLAVAGVRGVPAMRLGFAVSPVGTTDLAVGAYSIALFDTTRIVVNVV